MRIERRQVESRRAGTALAALLVAIPCLLFGVASSSAAGGGATATASATTTFTFTGGEQVFKVPDGVTSITVTAIGGRGSSGEALSGSPAVGGVGAAATGTVAVSPGQNLFVNVGGNGSLPTGGFNGGGDGGSNGDNFIDAGGGGGATDIRTITRAAPPNSTLNSRLIIAGGGGGGGGTESPTGLGGGGGRSGFVSFSGAGERGGNGVGAGPAAFGGDGGEQSFGGIGGGGSAVAGSFGQGGNGGAGGPDSYPGGGGGGGSFGGGGGANSANDEIGGGGGGAGSISFAPTVTSISFQGDSTTVPLLRITYEASGGSGLKFGKVKLNKQKGTATLPVTVPGSGNLTVGGKGVVKKRPGLSGNLLARKITEAGTYKLKVKAKGRKKSKLLDTGKVKVKAVISFKPTSGDKVSDSKRIRLKKN